MFFLQFIIFGINFGLRFIPYKYCSCLLFFSIFFQYIEFRHVSSGPILCNYKSTSGNISISVTNANNFHETFKVFRVNNINGPRDLRVLQIWPLKQSSRGFGPYYHCFIMDLVPIFNASLCGRETTSAMEH